MFRGYDLLKCIEEIALGKVKLSDVAEILTEIDIDLDSEYILSKFNRHPDPLNIRELCVFYKLKEQGKIKKRPYERYSAYSTWEAYESLGDVAVIKDKRKK